MAEWMRAPARLDSSLIAVAVLVALPAFTMASEVALVKAGRPVARITCLGDDECADAVAELREHVKLMSGAELPLAEKVAAKHVLPESSFVLLCLAQKLEAGTLPGQEEAIRKLKPEGFWLFAGDSVAGFPCVAVVGRDSEGLYFGVCELLEKLGCRWYMPGEIGRRVPRRSTVLVQEMSEVQNPDFILRNMWWAYGGRPDWQRKAYATWQRRNKMGGVGAAMGHNLHRVIEPSVYGKTHAEYFPMRGGKRYIPKSDGEQGWQPCTSNPDVIGIAAQKAIACFDANPGAYSFSLSPADGYGWCQCEKCAAQDPEEFRGMTNRGKGRRMTIFANEVARRLAAKHPDKYVCWYAYVGTVEAPDDVNVHPNVVISLAHYGWCGCNIHSLRDGRCRMNPKFLDILNAWSTKTDKLFIREYWTTLTPITDGPACVCAAYSLAEDIPFLKSKGVIGFSSESLPDYGAAALNFWIAARKMWRADADTEALLEDYYAGMYGPAAPIMRGYFERICKHCRAAGDRGPYFDDELLSELRVIIENADAACATKPQQDRIRLTLTLLDYVIDVRAYIVRPSSARREALSAKLDEIEESESLAVDFVSQRHRLGRKLRVPTQELESYCGAKLRPYSSEPLPDGESDKAFTVRGVHGFATLVGEGEDIEGRVQSRRVGRYLSPCGFVVLGPDGAKLAEGETGVGDSAPIKCCARKAGVHLIVVNTGSNAARVFLCNRSFCLVGRNLSFLGAQPAGFVYVLDGSDRAELTLRSDATGDPKTPGETARMVVRDPEGNPVADGDTVSGKSFSPAMTVKPGQDGKAWRVELCRAKAGIMEDLRLQIGLGCAEFFATHPSRLLVPVE